MSPDCAVLTGDDAVAAIRRHRVELDHGAAFCQRGDWLLAAVAQLPGEPVMVVDTDPAGSLTGYLALAVHRRFGLTKVTGLADDLADYAPARAADGAVAGRLAQALREWLTTARCWTLRVDQLDVADVLTAALLDVVPGAALTPGAPMPQLTGPNPDTNVGRNRRKAMSQALNRLRADGTDWSLDRHTGPGQRPLVEQIVALRRTRDHATGRGSHLDDPAIRGFFVDTLMTMLAEDRADIHTLTVGSQLAGYSIAVRDPGVHRIWDGRLAGGFERYSPGALTGYQALQLAMADPTVGRVDWLRGVTVEKVHNEMHRRWSLRGASGPMIAAAALAKDGAVAGAKARVPDELRRRLLERR